MADDEDLALVSHGLREDFGAPPIEGIIMGEGEDEAYTGTVMDGCVEERRELVEIGIEGSGWWPRLEDVIRHWNVPSLGQESFSVSEGERTGARLKYKLEAVGQSLL